MEQIKLNTIPSGVPSVCHISQFDNTSRIIRCHLFNGSDPLTLTGSETIRLFIRKSDNSRAEFEIESASGSFIDLVITSEMSDIAGDSECKFQITDSEKTIGTLNFKMIVEPDAYGDSLKTRSISGPIATFETDLAEDLIKLDVDLEPVQDLHGYDYPWPAGGGKNLLKMSGLSLVPPSSTAFSNATKRTFTSNSFCLGLTSNNYYQNNKVTQYSVEDNNISVTSNAKAYAVIIPITNLKTGETYTLSASSSQGRMSVGFWEEDGTFISSTQEVTGGVLSFSVPQNTFYSGLSFNPLTENIQATFTDIQLEKDSVATEWAPYSNICPISGHDSAQLFRTGKNLLKDIKTQNGPNQVWLGQGLTPLFGTFLKSGTYTIKYKTAGSINSIYYQEINASSNVPLGTNLEKTFTIDKSSYYRFWLYKSSGVNAEDISDVQLELGSTATDYEPYVSDPTPVTVQFGQTIYKGKLYSEQRKVLVTHVGMDLGYFTWNHYVTETRNYFYSNQPPPISPKGTVSPEINDDISSIYACERYADVVNGYTYSWIHSGFTLPATTKRLYIYDEAMENSDAAAFKTRVTGQQFVYEVAEPFYIDLTQIQTASIESSPVASFETTLAMPLNTSEHSFSCSQAEGTPTPDSPISITGVSEVTAIRTGKNICPLFIAYSGNGLTTTVNPDGTVHVTGTATGSGGFITSSNVLGCAIPSGQQITISISNTIPARLRQFLAGGSRNSTSDINVGERSTTFSRDFEIASIRLYLFTTAGQSYDFSFKLQIELGSTATPYEPYSGESITVSLGGTYYGGKLVQSEDGSRKIVLRYAQLVLSSANANIINRVNANKYRVFNADCGAKITGSDYADIKCNKMSSQTGTTNDNRCYINSAGDIRMNFTSEYDTVVDMIAAMESITVVYPLETPIEITLPDGDPLNAVVGENNVYCNTGDTALTYYYNMVADPIRIPALVGTNNVYSDAGDVDVEYYTTLEGGND